MRMRYTCAGFGPRGRRLGLFATGLALLTWTAHHGFQLDVAQASPETAAGQTPASSSSTTPTAIQSLSQALLAEEVSQQFYTLNGAKPYLTTSDLVPFNSMVTEISAGHHAHVTMLQQLLGSSAPAMPAFQSLDASSLSQFMSMAEKIEDIDVDLHQGVLVTALQSGATSTVGGTSGGTTGATTGGTAAGTPAPAPDAVEVAILADDARYDGGIRAFEKTTGTANGGNPNTTLTQSGTPLSPGFTFGQAQAALQSFVVGSTPGTVTAGPSGTPAAPAVSFSKDILRIFTNNGAKTCAQAGCHGGPNPQLGQDLSAANAYASIVNHPSVEKPSLLRVKPGDSANSYLYKKITGAPGIVGSRMPLSGGPLVASDIDLIRRWIDAGAPNN